MKIYNHHVVFIELNKSLKSAFTCDTGAAPRTVAMSILFGGATEVSTTRYGTVGSELKTGYYIGNDRKMLNMFDVVNYNNVERTIYVQSELEYLPGKPEGFVDTGLQLLNPGICGGQQGVAIQVPKGAQKFQVNSTGILVASDGYIVSMSKYLRSNTLQALHTNMCGL
jgi:hypothetical protein